MRISPRRNAGLWFLAMVVTAAAGLGQSGLYQGNLEDFGESIPDGEYTVSFSVWSDEMGGELLWREEHEAVRIEGGRFFALLSEKNLVPQGSSELWLELEVDGDPLWPRVLFPLQSNAAVQIA
jgi:hypothetical protein